MKKILLVSTLLLIFLTGCGNTCEHNYQKEIIDVTCTEDGYTLYKCSLCGDSYKSDVVSAKGHQSFVSSQGYAPTCEEAGMTDEYSCSLCNKVIKASEKIFALGHEYGKWVEVTKPSKETEGLLTKTCETDKTHVLEKTLPKLNNQDYGYEINNPTCTSTGLETYVYKVDGQEFTYKVVLDKLPHTYNAVVTKPTCLEKGYTTYTCECGDTYVDDYVNATGHSHTSVVTEPTCLEKGYTTHTCHCGDTYVDTYVDATGHSYNAKIIDPTCEAKGYTLFTCRCGDSYKDTYVDALGHKFINYVNDNNPGCETNETKTAICENGCGLKDIKEIEGTSIGHNYGEWEMTEEPSLTKGGILTKYCNNDNTHTITKELPILNKTDYIFSGKDATCTEAGKSSYEYVIDGQTFKIDLELDALGHTYTSVVTDPTCLEEGYTTHTCHCGESYTDSKVSALGHEMTTTKEKVNPTCKDSGLTEEISCTRCDYIEQAQTVIEPLGHTNTDGDYYCDRCEIPYGENVVKISTYEELNKIKENPNGFFQLTNDIDLSGQAWGYRFDFYGYLYGDGYTIKGLTTPFVNSNYGTIDSLNISNVTIEVNDVENLTYGTNKKDSSSNTYCYGIFSVYNIGTIKNSKISGSNSIKVKTELNLVTDSGCKHTKSTIVYFGGFAGQNNVEGIITNCEIEGVITLDSHHYVYHKLCETFNYNDEQATSNQTVYFGGLVGLNEGSVTKSKITGYVSIYYYLSAKHDKGSLTLILSSAEGRANGYTHIYYGAIASINKGTITDIIVNNKPTTLKDSNSKIGNFLTASGVTKIYQGTYTEVKFISIANYEYLIGENTGTISDVTKKY